MEPIKNEDRMEQREEQQQFLNVDELLTDFPVEFETELHNFGKGAVCPSQKIIVETRQKMIQVHNLQLFEEQQEDRSEQSIAMLEDRLLDYLLPIVLLLTGLSVVTIGFGLYLFLPTIILKQLTLSLFVMFGSGLLVLAAILYRKQKQVKQRSQEKCQN